TAEQVNANMRAIEANQKNIAGNQTNIAANQQNIATNQQNIGANKQQIEQNIKDIKENTDRFTALAEYDVKAQAAVKLDVGSSKISDQDQEELKNLEQTVPGITG